MRKTASHVHQKLFCFPEWVYPDTLHQKVSLATSSHYNRIYNDEAIACANFIQDMQLFPQVNRTLLQEIYYISTC